MNPFAELSQYTSIEEIPLNTQHSILNHQTPHFFADILSSHLSTHTPTVHPSLSHLRFQLSSSLVDPHTTSPYAYLAKTSLIISNVLFSSTSKSCSPVSHILNCTYSLQRASLSATSTPWTWFPPPQAWPALCVCCIVPWPEKALRRPRWTRLKVLK